MRRHQRILIMLASYTLRNRVRGVYYFVRFTYQFKLEVCQLATFEKSQRDCLTKSGQNQIQVKSKSNRNFWI